MQPEYGEIFNLEEDDISGVTSFMVGYLTGGPSSATRQF